MALQKRSYRVLALHFLGSTLIGIGLFLAVWLAVRSLFNQVFLPLRAWELLYFMVTFGFGGVLWSLQIIGWRSRRSWFALAFRCLGASSVGLGVHIAVWFGVRSLFYEYTIHVTGAEWLFFPLTFGVGIVFWRYGGLSMHITRPGVTHRKFKNACFSSPKKTKLSAPR